MCLSSEEKAPSSTTLEFHYFKRTRRSKLKVHSLVTNSRRICDEHSRRSEDNMKLMNIKLYLENQTIIEENEKLRKTAHLLHQQNLALFSELKKKLSNSDRRSIDDTSFSSIITNDMNR